MVMNFNQVFDIMSEDARSVISCSIFLGGDGCHVRGTSLAVKWPVGRAAVLCGRTKCQSEPRGWHVERSLS